MKRKREARKTTTVTALCVKQPWANLIAAGRKTIETRTWDTDYRGPLLIVASKAVDEAGVDAHPGTPKWPRGEAIAYVELVDVREMKADADEDAACCAWFPGAYAWILSEPRLIPHPWKVKGRLGLFAVEAEQ